MTLVMAYAILVSAAIAASAALLDLLFRARGGASRWVWMLAFGLIAPVTGLVMLAPRPTVSVGTPAAIPVEVPLSFTGTMTVSGQPVAAWLDMADAVLVTAWVTASVLLVIALIVGQWRVARTRRSAPRGKLLGHPVLFTEDLGPAVAGVASPVVLVPRWVQALDDASQRLLLAHEMEHARRRDTTLLMGGAAMTALLPWNPVVWWLAWRLRLAIELDCDRRVLAANPGVRRYVDLLLVSAGRPRLSARFLAAHLGEHAKDLERRIEAMTDTRLHWRPALATTAVAAVLIAVACEAPRPDPIAPRETQKAVPQEAPSGVYYEFQVEKPVTLATGSVYPRYPDILREAGVEGVVLVSFVVNEDGQADLSTFKVLKSTHDLFAAAVRKTLPAMDFVAAEAGGRKVRQLVQQPFMFALATGKVAYRRRSPSDSGLSEVTITGVPREVAFSTRRGDSARVALRDNALLQDAPSLLITDKQGKELRRYVPKVGDEGKQHLLEQIKPEDIEAIEVYKPTACPADRSIACPLILIRVKEGREAAYRER